jgi:hypothetical protein
MKKQSKLIMVPMTILVTLSVWIILQADITDSNDSSAIPGLPTAIAGVQYGIQGQQAPELNLTTWINGYGLSIDPIELNNLRGKVIYLYFFQDW